MLITIELSSIQAMQPSQFSIVTILYPHYIYYRQRRFLIMSKQKISQVLPIGYAQQVMELEMKIEDEETVQAIQILSKLYRIGVDYYLQNDLRKATYLQKKLNNLVLRSLQTKYNDSQHSARKRVSKQLKEETQKITNYEQSYINSWLKQSQKSQKKIKDCLTADLNRQQQRFQSRRLQRMKSAGKQ